MVELDVSAIAPSRGDWLSGLRCWTLGENVQEPLLVRSLGRILFQERLQIRERDEIRRCRVRLQAQGQVKLGMSVTFTESANVSCKQLGRSVGSLEVSMTVDAMLICNAGELQLTLMLTMTCGTGQSCVGWDLSMIVFGGRMTLQTRHIADRRTVCRRHACSDREQASKRLPGRVTLPAIIGNESVGLRKWARFEGPVIAVERGPQQPTAAGQGESQPRQPGPSPKTMRPLVEFQFCTLGQLANVSGHGDQLTCGEKGV